MANELRKTGISIVGEIPWGTHFSLLCETTQDFLDTLVPYFKAGLENNEFCLWVVSQPLTQQDATDALGHVMPDIDRYLAQRSIEILSHDQWYLQQGIFDLHKATKSWEEKLDQALARGYAGLRGIGNEGRLTEQYWRDFAQYEKELDRWIAHKRMIALCTYPLAAMSGVQVFDVANSHQFVMARRHGNWQVLETPELIQAKAEIQRLNEELEQRVIERTRELAAANEDLKRENTERKRAEQGAWQSQKLVSLVLATLPVGVSVIDRAGNIVLANETSKRIWGSVIISGRERWAQTKAFWHDSGQRIAPTEWASVRALSEGQTSLNELIDIETYDGQQKTIHNSVAPIRDAEGQIVGAVIVNEDVTERKRAEEAIRKSEQVLREAESLGHTGSWEQNLVTGEIFNTEENLRLFFGDDHSKGKHFEDYAQTVHPDDREFVMQRRAQLLAEGGPRDIEYRVVWPDGSVHVLFGRATLVRDELGQAIRIYGTNVDITERKQAEAAIRSLLQISEKLHATLDIDALLASLVIEAMELIDAEIGWSGLRSSEGMVCHTHITRDLQVVPFEYFLPPSVGLPGWVLVHKVPYVMNDAQADKLIIPEIRERFGVKALIDTPILDAQGEVIGFFEVGNKKNGAGFSESDVEKLVAVSRIASIALQNAMSYRNLERAEKALRESQLHLQLLSRQLLQAQEAERRSIARELHDEIGQQLTALGLILTSEHPSPEQLSNAYTVVRDLIDRLHNLSLDLRPTILDDLGLLPALVWLFERYTAQTNVSVHFEHSSLEEQRFDPEVETSAYRIIQEALTNVARHADVRDVTVRLWTDDDTLSVMIVDAGRGFDPHTIDTRATSGLAGMQERAALLGGDVTVESADGKGTRLTVTLPLHTDSGSHEEEQAT